MAQIENGLVRLPYESGLYHEAVALRNLVLRQPLGLEFTAEELSAEADSHHFGLFENGRLLACVILKVVDEDTLKMRQFAVHPDHQRKGLGSELVRHAESFAIARGYRRIVLHARESALPFYLKQGYETEGGCFTEVSLPHFRMGKRLELK